MRALSTDSFPWLLLLSDPVQESTLDDDGAVAKAIAGTLAGEPGAFEKIVERFQGTISLQMRRFSRDAGVVEELVHDVFVEAFVSLRSFRGRSPFLHWLRKVAVRTGYRYWKRLENEPEQSPMADNLVALAAPRELAPVEANEALSALLSRVAPRDRLVLLLLYVEGYSAPEVASLTGWSVSMVRVQGWRARNRLRAALKKEGLDWET